MPLSKNEALRDILKVTMHWYWFQTFTILSIPCSSELTLNMDSKLSQ